MNTLSTWQEIAFHRWPVAAEGGRIHGDGRFAITIPKLQKAILFKTENKRRRALDRIDEQFILVDLEEVK